MRLFSQLPVPLDPLHNMTIGRTLLDLPDATEYEALTLCELATAASAKSPAARRDHLNQAAIFADLRERTERDAVQVKAEATERCATSR